MWSKLRASVRCCQLPVLPVQAACAGGRLPAGGPRLHRPSAPGQTRCCTSFWSIVSPTATPATTRRVQRRNPGGWHGGDLKGLTQQLDELKDLGVTALWINPVQLQQRSGMPAQAPAKMGIPEFTHEAFHGYWIADFDKVDPRFGSEADLKALVDAAHQRGIKVLLDVVYNHTGYQSEYADRRTAAGEKWVRVGEGNCEVDAITCAVGGLPDLKTEISEIRDHLLAANIAPGQAHRHRRLPARHLQASDQRLLGRTPQAHTRRTRQGLLPARRILGRHGAGPGRLLRTRRGRLGLRLQLQGQLRRLGPGPRPFGGLRRLSALAPPGAQGLRAGALPQQPRRADGAGRPGRRQGTVQGLRRAADGFAGHARHLLRRRGRVAAVTNGR